MRNIKLGLIIVGVVLFLVLASGDPAGALSRGPFLERTGAPGEQTCVQCHHTYPLDSGPGRVEILGLPERYLPGVFYPVTVRVSDPTARMWGFEITAVDETGAAAGFFQKLDPSDFSIEALGPSERLGRFYARQTIQGAYTGQTGAAEWHFKWKAPASDRGSVTFYAVGNAANNDGTDLYDYIYTTNVNVDGQTRNVRVRLLAPASGASLGAGEPALVTWEASDGDTAAVESFRLELSTDGGATFATTIASGLAADRRAFVWQVPEALRAERARLRVVALDTEGAERAGASPDDLRIAPLGLELRDGAFPRIGAAAFRFVLFDPTTAATALVATSDGRVTVLARTADGRFTPRAGSGLEGARSVRAAAWDDADGDGDGDLALATDGGIELYLNDGQGVFTIVGAPTLPPSSGPLRAVVWADVDGDGDADVVGAGPGGAVALAREGSGYEDRTVAWGLGAASGDVLAVAGATLAVGDAAGLRLYRFDGGTFQEAAAPVVASVGSLAWVDATGDGLLDLVAAGTGGATVLAARGDGLFLFEDVTAALGLAGLGPVDEIRAGDYDGDAREDLFVAARTARVFRATEDGFEEATARLGIAGGATRGVWTDADASGSLDLVALDADRLDLYANPRARGARLDLEVPAGAVVRLGLDGDLDWSTGAGTTRVAGLAGRLTVAIAAERAGVRVELADATAVERVVALGSAPFAPLPAPSALAARLKANGAKLVVDGMALPAAGAALEVAGIRFTSVKVPRRAIGADGRATRLVVRDARLAALFAGDALSIRVVDTVTGAVSAPLLVTRMTGIF